MRILLVTWNYPPKVGGMERILAKLVRNLRSQALVQVFAPYAAQSHTDAEEEQTTRPERDGLVWFAWYALRWCTHLLSEDRYDVVIAGSALVTPLAYILGRAFEVPVVVITYGLDVIYPHPLYQWMIKTLLPRCDQVSAISQATKKEMLRRGVPADRISIVHPGLDFSAFETVPDVDAIRERHDLQGRLVLLCVGRLTRRKGQLDFVKHSLPAIVEAYPNSLCLLVGGNPTQSLSHKEDIATQIKHQARTLDLEAHVRMVGEINWAERQELIDLYHACDVFILPAVQVPGDMEGFGIVLTEAAAAGKPVVSTRLGGITDAVIDGKSGILVESETWDEFSDATLTLLGDESLRRRMGHFGRERVRTELDWPIIARQYLTHLEAALQNRR
jgi:phosphatidylinositol alpha-1,6-mannosyltransferase